MAQGDFSTASTPPRYCSGLRNQGATCYLNGLLQSLFHLSALREAVYRLRLEQADIKGDQRMGLALQRLWWTMQTGDHTAVADTAELTQSFGWDTNERFRQHDIQELLMVWVFGSLEALFESQMPADDNIVHRLFRGERRALIRVPGIQSAHGGPWTTLAKGEPFTDIQVDIRAGDTALSSLEDGLQYMLRPERMDGKNRYRYDPPDGGSATWHDAWRSDMLTQLPPVLLFHLRRFGRSAHGGFAEKVQERFDFPAELNMAPFQHAQGDEVGQDEGAWYDLHATMVHAGTSAQAGHYYAFVRLRGEEAEGDRPRWFKFDDTRVSVATELEAIQDNYGGYVSGVCRTAYVLMYVRRGDAPDLVYKPRAEVVPNFLARDRQLADERRRWAEQQELRRSTCLLTIFTAERLASDDTGPAAATALLGRESVYVDEQAVLAHDEAALDTARMTVHKRDSLDRVHQEVGAFLRLTEVEHARLRLWICPTDTQHVPRQLARGDEHCACELGYGAEGQIQCTLFAEWEEAVGAVVAPALLIVWEYHKEAATLQFLGCRVVDAHKTRHADVVDALLSSPAQSMTKIIWHITGPARGADHAPTMVKEEDQIGSAVELIICQCTSTSVTEELRASEQSSLADFFLWWRREGYRAMVRPRDGSDEGFPLRLLRHWRREEIQAAVAQHLQRPPVCVRLWTTPNGPDGQMTEGVPLLPKDPARNMLPVWYEITADRPADVGKHMARVVARDAGGNILGKAFLVLPDKPRCCMLHLLLAAQKVWPELGDPADLRLIEVSQHTIAATFDSTYHFYANPWAKDEEPWVWNSDSLYRVEPEPERVANCPPGAASWVVPVCHYFRLKGDTPGCMNSIVPFGDPFRMSILDTDTPGDVLLRARKKLGLCAEPAPPPDAPVVPLSSVLHETGHIAATTDEEEKRQVQRALVASLSVPVGGNVERPPPSEWQAPPADKRNPHAAPGDDGTSWHVAVLTKRDLFEGWSEGRELGEAEIVWNRVLNSMGLCKVTIGLEHYPPPALSAPTTTFARPPSAGGGVVMRVDG